MYLNSVFSARLGNRSTVSVQNPIRVSPSSEPQPDLALLRPRADFYASGHPSPADVLLVVEIADSSLVTDRDVKTPLYARAQIRETWVLNLVSDTLEIYRQPSPDGYREVSILRDGDTVSPEAFPDVVLSVAAILGLPRA
jgi:Uma2 family endonuclease